MNEVAEPRPAPREGRRNTLALLLVIGVVLVLSFVVFRPFLVDVTVAASVALLLSPFQRRLTRALGGRTWLSALILALLCMLAILLPIFASVTILGRQAVGFAEWSAPRLQPAELQKLIEQTLPERFPWLRSIDSDTVSQVVSGGLSKLVSSLNGLIQSLVGRATTALLDVLLFVMLLFFLLRDGETLRRALRGISPLSPDQEREIFEHLSRTVKGVLQAMILVPLAQGFVAAPAFAFLGVPRPALWSFAVVLAAFVPILGSPLAWVPAVLYLYSQGETGRAGIMLAYGIVVISGIDNIVKPLVLQGAAKIHPLLAFLATMGGLISFGPAGFFVGPVVLSLLLSTLKIYGEFVNRRRSDPAATPAG